MLYYDFYDYKDFQERFGIVHHGNGAKNRKNKILLAYIKNKELLHQARISNDYSLLHISSMSELKQVMMKRIQDSGINKKYPVRLINTILMSDQYQTDDKKGLCEDGDFKAVRYINMTNKKIYKMRAGKFLRALVLETEFGQTLPEQVLGYLCEEFTQDWTTYAMGTLPKNQLVVSDEFQKIYSSECCKGDFKSCMVNRDFHDFYSDSVDASAAYLTNEDGLIIARCIIYNKCYDEDGKIYSFKYYNYNQGRAYNHQEAHYEYNLDTTEGSIDGSEEEDEDEHYDEYHDCYTGSDTVSVLYRGREMTCAENNLDDFTWCEEAEIYVYTLDTAHCSICDNDYIKEDAAYSDLTGEYYCCAHCKEKAEQEYKEENWFWSEYDHQYFENEDEITEIYKLNRCAKDYEAFIIHKKTLEAMLSHKKAFFFEGEYYDTINKRTGKPFFYYRKKMAA